MWKGEYKMFDILYFWGFGLLILVFFLVRNQRVFDIFTHSRNAIHKYTVDMIEKGKFEEIEENLYDKMQEEYDSLLFQFLRWGKHEGVKKQYLELLKPYFD